MIKRLKHIVSLSMVIIFLTPLITELFDVFFHHHERYASSAQEINHVRTYHKKCPIPDFQLSIFSLQTNIAVKEKVEYFDDLIVNFRSDYYLETSDYSVLLRAPPALTNFL